MVMIGGCTGDRSGERRGYAGKSNNTTNFSVSNKNKAHYCDKFSCVVLLGCNLTFFWIIFNHT